VWLTITNVAVLNNGGNPDIVTNATGKVLLSNPPKTFTYDFDGNLTQDGLWTNRWDGENRLIEMESIAGVPAGAKRRLLFSYDAQGRRNSMTVSNWLSGNWQGVTDGSYMTAGVLQNLIVSVVLICPLGAVRKPKWKHPTPNAII
jgi:hypothetical protein